MTVSATVRRGLSEPIGVLEHDLHAAAHPAHARASTASRCRRPRTAPRRRSARSGAAAGGRWSTCRSPTRRPGRASRRARSTGRRRRRRASAARCRPAIRAPREILGETRRLDQRAHAASLRQAIAERLETRGEMILRGSCATAAARRRIRRASAGSAARTGSPAASRRPTGAAPATDASCPRGPVTFGTAESSARV